MAHPREMIRPARDWPEWEPSEARLLTGEPKRFTNGMSWEMDETGNHRIVDPDGVGGDWAQYGSIAVSPSGRHICVSAYFDGTLPCETILEIGIVGVAPGSLGPDAGSAVDQSTIGILVSGGPGAQSYQICGDDEGAVVTEALEAVKRLYQIGAGTGFLVNRCADQAQHDRIMVQLGNAVDVWSRSSQAPRRSAHPG